LKSSLANVLRLSKNPSVRLRLCLAGLQRAGGPAAKELLDDCRAAGDPVEIAPCLDRCQQCEIGFVAVVDGTPVFAKTAAEFLRDLQTLRA